MSALFRSIFTMYVDGDQISCIVHSKCHFGATAGGAARCDRTPLMPIKIDADGMC